MPSAAQPSSKTWVTILDCLGRKQMFKTGQNPRSWPQDYCSLSRWIPIMFWSRLSDHQIFHCRFSHNTYAVWLFIEIIKRYGILYFPTHHHDFKSWYLMVPPSSPYDHPPPKFVGARSEKHHNLCFSRSLILRNFSKHRPEVVIQTFIKCWCGTKDSARCNGRQKRSMKNVSCPQNSHHTVGEMRLSDETTWK